MPSDIGSIALVQDTNIDFSGVDRTQSITLTYYNVTKVINVRNESSIFRKATYTSRTLLNDVSGVIGSGQVTALMGPSGSGKTTLLNTLAGRNLSGVTGQVYFNGVLYNKSVKRQLAYVLQEDLFFDKLTVTEQLTYTALLRLPNDLTKHEKHEQVAKIISTLNLEKCATTEIALISGGEKKRVNIGTELLTNPSVIFLDEPTSGLDSTSASGLIVTLRDLARNGKTIITSIHQPSSQVFGSFDQLILLANGRTVYQGEPSAALTYFASLGHQAPAQYNPADYVMDLLNSDDGIRRKLIKAYKKHSAGSNRNESILPVISTEPTNAERWPVGFFAQFAVLYRRSNRISGKQQFSLMNIIQTIALAIISGLCWLRMPFKESTIPDRSSFIFFIMTYWPFNTLYDGLMSYPFERSVINKERASGSYRLSAYFMAKTCSEAPVKLVLPTVYLIISYWMANINPYFQYFLGFLTAELLAVLVAESIGLFIGASMKDMKQSFVLATIWLLGLMLVGGFFIQNLPGWLTWTKWLSFFKYSFDACLNLQFSGSHRYNCIDGSYITACRENDTLITTVAASEALPYFKVDLGTGENFAVLIAMIILFRLCAYISLRFIKNSSGRA